MLGARPEWHFQAVFQLGLHCAWSYFSQVQDLIVSLVELHKIPDYPILQLVQVPLNDSTPNISFQFSIICKLSEGPHCPTIHIVNEQVIILASVAASSACVQLDLVLLISFVWDQPLRCVQSTSLSIYLTHINIYKRSSSLPSTCGITGYLAVPFSILRGY